MLRFVVRFLNDNVFLSLMSLQNVLGLNSRKVHCWSYEILLGTFMLIGAVAYASLPTLHRFDLETDRMVERNNTSNMVFHTSSIKPRRVNIITKKELDAIIIRTYNEGNFPRCGVQDTDYTRDMG